MRDSKIRGEDMDEEMGGKVDGRRTIEGERRREHEKAWKGGEGEGAREGEGEGEGEGWKKEDMDMTRPVGEEGMG